MILKTPAILLLLSLLSFGATIDLKTAGAKGDGTTDDTTAIQNAINASQVGDTIQCPAGTFKLTNSITFLSSRTYQGLAGCSIVGSIGTQFVQLEYSNAHDLTIDGFTFDGGGIVAPGNDSTKPPLNVTISNNKFQNIAASGTNYNSVGILAQSGFSGQISGNIFTNIYPGGIVGPSEVAGAIWLWNPSNAQITSNIFDKNGQAIHVTLTVPYTAPAHDVTISGNIITRSARYNIEVQGTALNNLTVSNNNISQFQPGINGQNAISIAVGGTGHQVLNNVLQGPNEGNPSNQSSAIEFEGTGVVQGNIAGHFGGAQSALWTDGQWQTKNNTWCDMNYYPPPRNILFLDTNGQNPAVNTGNTYTASCAGVAFSASPGVSACDLNNDGVTNVIDVQLAIDMALGVIQCTANINGAGICEITTVQRVVNAALGNACVIGP